MSFSPRIEEVINLASRVPGWGLNPSGAIRSDCGCPIAAAGVVSGAANRFLASSLWVFEVYPTTEEVRRAVGNSLSRVHVAILARALGLTERERRLLIRAADYQVSMKFEEKWVRLHLIQVLGVTP